MTTYQYTPLDETAKEIRLLTLHPGSFKDPIVISLKTEVLTQDHIPKFEALSYAWGSTSDPMEILVDSEKPQRLLLRESGLSRKSPSTNLSVTQNLHQALKYLRYKHELRTLWIDAICANQQDLKERGHQVRRMSDIYSSADRVVVWLGPESDTSAQAMKIIDNIGSRINVNWGLQTMTAATPTDVHPESWDFHNAIDLDTELWLSIRDLLTRPWFQRLWVWQEVGLAKHDIVILCGSSAGDYWRLTNAIFWLRTYRPINVPSFDNAYYQGFCLAQYSNTLDSSWNLHDIIYVTRGCKCSDKRDRVYGVLSLCDESDRAGILPDYTKSVQEVFEACVLQQSEKRGSLMLLTLCSMRDAATDLPTWVNWSVSYVVKSIRLVCADAEARAHVCFPGDGVLVVKGVCAATVSQIELERDALRNELGSLEDTELAETIVRFVKRVVGSKSVDATESRLEAICRTLCCDEFSDVLIPTDNDLPNLQEAVQYFMECWSWSLDSSTPVPKGYFKFIGCAARIIRGRSLIETIDGKLGLVPKGTRAGDIICIILGCRTPLILRQDEASHYSVVGECYVEGIMTGEALLGQLPNNWKLVRKWFPQYHSYVGAFLDCHTGKTQTADPRLGPLSAGWRIKSHDEEDAWNWYVNDETGEDSGVWDPRLTIDALRARGVEIKEFRLI